MKKLSTRHRAEPGTESIMCGAGVHQRACSQQQARPLGPARSLSPTVDLRRGGVRRSMRGSAARESHLTYT